MKSFNLNNYLHVAITEYGWKHLSDTVGNDYIANCIMTRQTFVEGKEYFKLQAHQIISLFGSALWLSFPAPLESTILIEDQFIVNKVIGANQGWECPNSPTGYCEYSIEVDDGETCIHCGKPEERK